MKGSLNILLHLLLVVIIIAAVVTPFIIILLKKTSPHSLATIADVEVLVSKINEACFREATSTTSNGPGPVEMSFDSLRQPLPALADRSEFITRMTLDSNRGEPSFVLYYEMFPPGHAIGWETYQSGFKYRAIAAINKPSPFSRSELESFTRNVDAKFRASRPDDKLDVLIANIVLTGDINPMTGKKISEQITGDKAAPSPLGTWDGDYFVFKGEHSLIESTFAKYLSCGDGNLCLLTSDGIKKYPLNLCTGANQPIDYVQFRIGSPKARSDFNIASPCSTKPGGKVKIYIPKNEQGEGRCLCKKIEYPIYEYDKNTETLSQKGTHTACLNYVDDQTSPLQEVAVERCVIVEFPSIADYCSAAGTGDLGPAGKGATEYIRQTTEYAGTVTGGGNVVFMKPPSLVKPQGAVPEAARGLFGNNGWVWP
ncbi:MAG: hypothetical protein HYY37_02360 [Candidatus Aenigmarchaeota archaeon]|nr:hypothetical protein [Candidatus Aenigmarchaeota archaeon]